MAGAKTKVTQTAISDQTLVMLQNNSIRTLGDIIEHDRNSFLALEGAKWHHLVDVGKALRDHGMSLTDGYAGPEPALV